MEHPRSTGQRLQVRRIEVIRYLVFTISLTDNTSMFHTQSLTHPALDDRREKEVEPWRQVHLIWICSILTHWKSKYAFEDFAIRQVAQLLGKTEEEARYRDRSFVSSNLRLMKAAHLGYAI